MRKLSPSLSWLTVGFTYVLMLWEDQFGLPQAALPFTAIAILLIALTLYFAFRSSKSTPALKRSSIFVLVFLVIQIVLNVLALRFSVVTGTLQLVLAILLLSGLISLASLATWGEPALDPANKKLRRFASAGFGALIIQLILGALVRRTYSDLACPQFPNCLTGQFFPSPFTFSTALAFIHRWWGILLLGLFVHLPLAARRSPGLFGPALVVLLLGVIQIALGITVVTSFMLPPVLVLHRAVGYALWCMLFFLGLRAGAYSFFWASRKR